MRDQSVINDPASPPPPAQTTRPRLRRIAVSLPFAMGGRKLPFWRGFWIGLGVMLPLVATALWHACKSLVFDADIPLPDDGAGAPRVGFIEALRNTVVFAGLACTITTGGLGRAVWRRSLRSKWLVTLLLAMLSGAVIGIACGLIGFTALGLPVAATHAQEYGERILPLLWRAALAGGLGGVLIGLLCRSPAAASRKRAPAAAVAAVAANRSGVRPGVHPKGAARKKRPAKKARR
ncbi:MAG: hypothetical protein IPL79_05670 [Myxococcales bacterium]|nr:hypothetical protein [Myxococcales bacterium]